MALKGSNIWVEREILKSKAFQALKSPAAIRVYLLFLTKRQCEQLAHKDRKGWKIKNNGEITFTYLEAQKNYGISKSTFRNVIDRLRNVGLIDIERSGQGTHKVTNWYRISERWKKYGTDSFVFPKPRKQGPINRGFKPGNQLGRNCKKS